jgi:RNA polymerase sigma-70 factor (ECF subfamily)
MATEAISLELIRAAAAGDRTALERILVRCGLRLGRYISKNVPRELIGPMSVDDVLQQTYVQAIRNIAQLANPTEAALWVWLKTIADNQVRDIVKAQQRRKRGGGRQEVKKAEDAQTSSLLDLVELLSDHKDTPATAAAREESIRAVQVAIAGLPHPQRQAIELRYLQGRSVADTAMKMDRTPGAINALLNRAKQKLRQSLGRSSFWFAKKG